MRIDRKRLERSMDDLGRIGETPRGGLTRLALTDDVRRGRDWMVAHMREAGLRVTVDQMGNIFGERAGAEALPPARWLARGFRANGRQVRRPAPRPLRPR